MRIPSKILEGWTILGSSRHKVSIARLGAEDEEAIGSNGNGHCTLCFCSVSRRDVFELVGCVIMREIGDDISHTLHVFDE